MKKKIAMLSLVLFLFACSRGVSKEVSQILKQKTDGIFAVLSTNKGEILLELNYKLAPLTVINFVGLSEGDLKAQKGKRFYDGLTFHRVIKDFVVQGGDPKGDGSGGPGYEFFNEVNKELTHKAGVVSMANAGPDTNGSQFFITLGDFPHLDGSYSVFGNVIHGMEIVKTIAQGDKINFVKIYKKGEAAKFGTSQADFDREYKKIKEARTVLDQKLLSETMPKIKEVLGENPSEKDGIYFKITKEGTGEKPANGKIASCQYTLKLLGGEKIDSSRDRGEAFEFQLGASQVIKGWDSMVADMKVGEIRRAIIPPSLAYGAMGAGNVIPPNAFLDFEIELVSVK